MVVLRADPWRPEYGMGFDAGFEDPPVPRADPTVETADWSKPLSPRPHPPCPVWFVDGVRRVELRLIAEDPSGRRVPGLFGTYAVGSVRCDGRASFGEHRVCRSVVLGGGVVPAKVAISVGAASLDFEPASDPGTDPDRPLWKLQQLMRQEEGNLAARTAGEEGCLVAVDGPLTFRDPSQAPVVGLVKRFSRQYLGPEQDSLIGRLAPGQRTPLFSLGTAEQPLERYAWYTRLAEFAPPWHDHAGIVRCEVRAGLGSETAIELADRVSAVLPSYAGRASDPRTPQNLAPVGGLETWLRHRMGHPGMVRRSLVVWLASTARGDD